MIASYIPTKCLKQFWRLKIMNYLALTSYETLAQAFLSPDAVIIPLWKENVRKKEISSHKQVLPGQYIDVT